MSPSRVRHKWGSFDRRGNDGTVYRDFDSVDAFARVANRGKGGQGRDMPWSSAGSRADDRFAGGSFANAVKMARGDGWTAALPEIDATRIQGDGAGRDFEIVYDVSGADVDMGRLMSGEPDCMSEALLTAPRSPVVSVLVPFGFNCNVDESAMRKRGAVVAAVLEWSRATGVTVEVWAVKAGSSGGKNAQRYAYSVFVGDSRGAYNPAVVAYAVGHPTMLRRLSFGVQDGESTAMQKALGSCRGCSVPITIDDIPVDTAGGAVVLPMLLPRGDDPVTVDWLLEEVRVAAAG